MGSPDKWIALLAVLAMLGSGCIQAAPVLQTSVSPPEGSSEPAPSESGQPDGPSDDQIASLKSLRLVSNYPLYVMHYRGPFRPEAEPGALTDPVRPSAGDAFPQVFELPATGGPGWGCSLFTALGGESNRYYGRNFDWQYSPALLLFANPPDGYASVSMVDLDYLIPADLRDKTTELADLPLGDREFLLEAPKMPFDGMNEYGLVVGMAAVFESRVPHDPNKTSIDSLEVIREMLDHARDVDQAISILQQFNVDMEGGPPLHYLIADRYGQAALAEFYDELVVIRSESPWHLATNHLRALANENGPSGCWRYEKIEKRLSAALGKLDGQQSLDLLRSVSQTGEYPTQWSVVYGIDTGEVRIVMGREFGSPVSFRLAPKED